MARFCSSASLGGVYLCRAEILSESLREIVEPILERGDMRQLQSIVERFGNRERLVGVAVYNRAGQVLAVSSNFKTRHKYTPPKDALLQNRAMGYFVDLGNSPIHVYLLPLRPVDGSNSSLAVFHDASYIGAEREQIWRDTLWHVAAQVLLVVFLTFLVVRWTILLPIARTTQWIKELQM